MTADWIQDPALLFTTYTRKSFESNLSMLNKRKYIYEYYTTRPITQGILVTCFHTYLQVLYMSLCDNLIEINEHH